MTEKLAPRPLEDYIAMARRIARDPEAIEAATDSDTWREYIGRNLPEAKSYESRIARLEGAERARSLLFEELPARDVQAVLTAGTLGRGVRYRYVDPETGYRTWIPKRYEDAMFQGWEPTATNPQGITLERNLVAGAYRWQWRDVATGQFVSYPTGS
jgi:hypothetical protein